MADNFIVPAGDSQGLALTDQMRKDAAAAAGSIESEGRLPHLYLCQATSDLVRNDHAVDKEYVISTGDDAVVNVGKTPMFIVLTAQTRYRYGIEDTNQDGKKYQRVVWDASKGALSRAQDADVDAKRAKRYTAFILIHCDGGVDPKNLGPLSFHAKGMNTLAGMRWADSVASAAMRGVPQFAVVWRLGTKLEDSVKGEGKWNVLTFEGPLRPRLDEPTYTKLRESWMFADAMRKRDAGRVVEGVETDEEHYAGLADKHVAQADADNYVSPPPPEAYGDDYATSIDPDVPSEATAAKMDWNTAVQCGRDDNGIMHRKPVPEMTFNEATAAAKLALPHVGKHAEATGAAALIEAWTRHKGWNPESLGFSPF